jgi:hypothetical protein
MTKEPRKPIPRDIELAVLDQSRRRCVLCFQLKGDLSEKHGQIAHLDDNPGNCAEDNLAFMCMEHHSLYDSTTRQHKNYTIHEAKAARAKLYDAIARGEHVAGTKPQPAGGRQADLGTLAVITARMTQTDTLVVLRQHNFGDPFATDVLDVIGEFRYRTGAGHEFIDQELEQKRASFLEACSKFSNDATCYTSILGNSHLRRVPKEWHTENREHYDKVVKGLNDKATALFDIYNDLVRSARRKLES